MIKLKSIFYPATRGFVCGVEWPPRAIPSKEWAGANAQNLFSHCSPRFFAWNTAKIFHLTLEVFIFSSVTAEGWTPAVCVTYFSPSWAFHGRSAAPFSPCAPRA